MARVIIGKTSLGIWNSVNHPRYPHKISSNQSSSVDHSTRHWKSSQINQSLHKIHFFQHINRVLHGYTVVSTQNPLLVRVTIRSDLSAVKTFNDTLTLLCTTCVSKEEPLLLVLCRFAFPCRVMLFLSLILWWGEMKDGGKLLFAGILVTWYMITVSLNQ